MASTALEMVPKAVMTTKLACGHRSGLVHEGDAVEAGHLEVGEDDVRRLANSSSFASSGLEAVGRGLGPTSVALVAGVISLGAQRGLDANAFASSSSVRLLTGSALAQQPEPPFGPAPGAQPQPPFGPQPQPPFGPQPPPGQAPPGQPPPGQPPPGQPAPGPADPFGPQPPPGQPPPGGDPGFSFGAQGSAGTEGFGAAGGADVAAPPSDSDAEWKRRELSLINQTNVYGSTGLLRTAFAGSGAEGTFRVSFLMDWFSTSGFLCDPADQTAAGQPITCSGENREDDASHVGGFFTLNATPLSFLEAYGSIRTYANSNSEGSPQLLQVLGDTTLGAKAFTPPKLVGPLSFGGELQLLLLNGTGDVGLAGGGTSAVIRGLASADLRELKNELPLRFNLNLAYKIDNSGELVEDVETQRAAAFDDGRDRQPITRIERFGLGINRVDFFQIYTGVEVPLPIVQPYLEYTVDIPVNRQGYDCNTNRSFRGDVCLGLENFNDPNSGGIGYAGIPSRLSLGTRVTPFKKAFRGLSGHLAFDIGLSGTSTFVEEIAPQAPWTLYLGIGYAFDTKEKPQPEPQIAPPPPPVVLPAPQNFLRGKVREQGTENGIADAVVTIAGSTEPPVASGPDGRFLSRHLEPGTYTLTVKAPGYKPGTCSGAIPPDPAQQPGQPGPFGQQPGQLGQPGQFGQPPPGQFGAQPPPAPPQAGPRFFDVDCQLEAEPKQGNIVGAVKDAESGAAVAGASITLVDETGKEQKFTADGQGGFRIEALDPGEVKLKVEAEGYLNHVSAASVAAAADTDATLRINKRPKTSLVRVVGNELKLSDKIHFEVDSAKILGDSNLLMAQIADVLINTPNIKKVEIQGHTDNTGTRDHNQQLSDARANSVRAWLVDAGVDGSRLVAKGYGQDRPIAPNVTAANKAKNRRVQFIILDKSK
jgi:outer membrane protein OmpA-like peptidoglycan-associated protein